MRNNCGSSVVSDSYRPLGLQPTRLLCPWDYPGKNTRVGCYFLLQGNESTSPMAPAQGGGFFTTESMVKPKKQSGRLNKTVIYTFKKKLIKKITPLFFNVCILLHFVCLCLCVIICLSSTGALFRQSSTLPVVGIKLPLSVCLSSSLIQFFPFVRLTLLSHSRKQWCFVTLQNISLVFMSLNQILRLS